VVGVGSTITDLASLAPNISTCSKHGFKLLRLYQKQMCREAAEAAEARELDGGA
jgi:hypothetical protein